MSGVCIRVRIPSEERAADKDTTTTLTADRQTDMAMLLRIPSMFFAPKYWLMRMENPWVKPVIKPMTKKFMELVQPMDAKALTPTPQLTTMLSTRL